MIEWFIIPTVAYKGNCGVYNRIDDKEARRLSHAMGRRHSLGKPPKPPTLEYSDSVRIVLELLKSDPDWIRHSESKIQHPSGVILTRGIHSAKDMILRIADENGDKYIPVSLTSSENQALYDTLRGRNERERISRESRTAKALANRILTGKSILDQPRLGNGREAESNAVGSSEPVGLLTYDSASQRIVQTVSGDNLKIALDDALLERYNLRVRRN